MTEINQSLPLVSFIMPVFNRVNVIERALLEIFDERKHNYSNLELVVIDGGSTDGTEQILLKYSDQIDYWVSEKDKGVADAFNKGVRVAKGQIIRYIASDDSMLQGHTRAMIQVMIERPELDVIGAQVECYDINSAGVAQASVKIQQFSDGWFDFNEAITWCESGVFSFIETWFFQRRVFEKIIGMDIQYRVATDVDLAFRIIKSDFKFFVLPRVIIKKFHYSDGTNNVSNYTKMIHEHRLIILKHAWFHWRAWKMLYIWPDMCHVRLIWFIWFKIVIIIRCLCPTLYLKLQQLVRS